MKTKAQKTEQVDGGIKKIEDNNTLIFADFSGTSANDINTLRKILYAVGAKFEVFKKRLLRVIFEKKGIAINPEDFEGQIGVAFSKESIENVASAIYSFAKQSKTFRIMGGFEKDAARVFSAQDVTAIGMLPSREVLLAQVVGIIAAPMSALLYVLSERSKQVK